MSEGWIALHRGWRDSPIFRDKYSRADAWVWLIELACWKPTRFDIKGKTVTLERGQLCASREHMAKAWQWSPSAVERFLARLQTEQMIGRETGQGKSVITIRNYAKYQDRAEQTGQENEQPIGQTSDRQRTAKEQGNKGTREPDGSLPPVPPRAKKPKVVKFAMPADWKPAELPPDIAELVAQWPPGRFEREVADVRDYWIEDGGKRPGWDRTLHSRIRNIHDRVMREKRNGLPARQADIRPSAGSRGERRNPLLDLVRATEADYPEEDREPDWQGGPTLRAIGQI